MLPAAGGEEAGALSSTTTSPSPGLHPGSKRVPQAGPGGWGCSWHRTRCPRRFVYLAASVFTAGRQHRPPACRGLTQLQGLLCPSPFYLMLATPPSSKEHVWVPGCHQCSCPAQITNLTPRLGPPRAPPACTVPRALLPGATSKVPAQGSTHGDTHTGSSARQPISGERQAEAGASVPGEASQKAHRDLPGRSGGQRAPGSPPALSCPRPAEGLRR